MLSRILSYPAMAYCSEKMGRDGEIRKYMDKRFAKLENFGPRDFYFQICEFCACKSNVLTDNWLTCVCGQVCNFFALFLPEKFCRKGLTGSWRGRRRHATGPPSACESGPARTPRGPYGKTAAIFRASDSAGNGKSVAPRFYFETREIQNFHDFAVASRVSRKGLPAHPRGPCGSENAPPQVCLLRTERPKRLFFRGFFVVRRKPDVFVI